jgi:hypothetical protein
MEPSAYGFDANEVLKRSKRLETAPLGGRLRWLLLRRTTDRRFVPLFGRMAALRIKRERFAPDAVKRLAPACAWLPVGPRNINGRIRCLAIHPTDPNVLYAGAADGGVWKTVDAGQSWVPLTDDEDSLSIGALALDPSAPDTVYAGTGEPLRDPDVGAYGWAYPGIGVLKSTDGGATWTLLGSIQNPFIYRIAVDPRDPSNLLCAGFAPDGSGGLCRFTPATGWTVIESGTFTDVLFDPVNPGRAYAGKYDGGVWRSLDSGAHWAPTAGVGGFGRVGVTLAPGQPSILYARTESAGLVYRSPDGGNSWVQLPDPGADVGPGGGAVNQRYWASYVAADPLDATGDTVYVGGIDLVRRELAGSGFVWNRISPTYNPPGPAWATHADHHDIAFVPGDSTKFYVATDGGVFFGENSGGAAPPVTWRKVSTGMTVTQFYDLATSAAAPSMFGGGCQDNGTLVSTGGASWRQIYGGDGSYLAFHPVDPWTVWAVRWDGGAIVQRSTDGGTTFSDAQGTGPNRISGGGEVPVVPLAMIPAAPATVFVGTDRVWRTTNGDAASAATVAWSARSGIIGTVTEITVADATVIYVGTMDGNLHFSRDGGATFAPAAAAPWPARWLSGITVRPGSPSTMFVTFHGFSGGPSDHVWKGVFDPTLGPNGTWTTAPTSIASNLPDSPVSALVVDPTTPTTLYVATEVGVFRSADEGGSWAPFDAGLPNAPVIDLALHPTRPVLRAATHGRGVFQCRLTLPCPDVDIYVRDNILDTGEVFPSPSGADDPTRPNERVYHWQSADIKVDAPPWQALDALVDGVEFDNATHRMLPFGYRIETVAGLTHENPRRANLNHVYVQAHNRGPRDATAVDVRLFWADAGAALPALPADFWSGFSTDSYTQGAWRLIGKKTIATLRSGRPHVVRFDWAVPAATSDHVCLLAMLDSPDDPLLPQALFDVDALTRSNKRVTHKNVHPVSAVTIAGSRIGLGWLRLYNAGRAERRFTLRVEGPADSNWTVTMVLPEAALRHRLAEAAAGFRVRTVDRETLSGWVAQAEEAGVVSAPLLALRPAFEEPVILDVESLPKGAEVRGVPIAPDGALPAVFVATQPRGAAAAPLRLDVIQLADDRVIGGSTFLIA